MPRWMGRYRRACITRPWGGIRRSRHTGGGDRSIARTTASGSDRYVDRLSDAWLQHWTADRGRNHPLCGLAFYFLVERIRHDGCRAYSIAPSREQRPSDKVNGLGGSWLSRRLYGAADHRVTGADSCPDYPEGGNCRACASDPCVRRTVVVGDAASSTGRRLPFVFESQFRSRFRPCVSADVRHHLLLFYYNLFAQSPDGFGLSPIEAGFSLMPLAVALFSFARAAPWLGISIGLRRMLACGSLILALGCAIAWVSIHWEQRFTMLVLGLSLAGAGLALPYASAPRVGLATLLQTQVGKGSGMLNSCSFLGGTVGITLGGLVFMSAGFSGVLVLLGLSALLAAALSLRSPERLKPRDPTRTAQQVFDHSRRNA